MQRSIPARPALDDTCELNHSDLYRLSAEYGLKPIDSRSRSMAKAVTYRLAGSATTGIIVFIFGGHNIALSAGAGGVDMVLKIGLYFLHERMWNRIDFGRVKEAFENPAPVSSRLPGFLSGDPAGRSEPLIFSSSMERRPKRDPARFERNLWRQILVTR